jgi:hypothetical protein
VISYIDQNQVDDYDVEIHTGYEKITAPEVNVLEVSSYAKDYTDIDFDDLSN